YHCNEADTGEQNEGAALNGLRYKLRPPTLEGRACQHTVLHCKKRKQRGIDEQGGGKGHLRFAVNAFRDNKIFDKTDHVKKGGEKQAVTENGVQQNKKTYHKVS